MLTIWRTEHIDTLERRLDRFRQQLVIRMLEGLRNQLSDIHSGHGSRAGDGSEREVGRSFLTHLQVSEEMEERLVKDIQKRLFSAIQSYHAGSEPSMSPSKLPPHENLQRLTTRFLASLKFTEIRNRQERIPKAAEDTFQWIYRSPEQGETQADFVAWLRGPNDIYWITGKPGSGKSTLMKFLDEDSRTLQHLCRWSRDQPLIRASFYFWNSGTEIQMSNEGLARSLLHQMFEAAPDLIPNVFPDRWESLNLFGTTYKPWSLFDLLQGLRAIARTSFSDRRFFFLIDGLDEFEGDKGELVALVKEMAASQHIKMCVSSRPWIEFQDAFESRPNLRMEYLTLPDIRIYVNSSFNASPKFRDIQLRSPEASIELLDGIAEKSSGVFLWVTLVVKSLLSGIANGDKFADLQRRLAELPTDLKKLFQKILESIEPRYKAQASQFFRIHEKHGSIPILRFAFADEDDVELQPSSQHTQLLADDFCFRCSQMKSRIDSRTKGLLEVSKWPSVEEALPSSAEEVPTAVRGKAHVQYLHRTVRDFFEKPTIWLMLSEWDPDFDPHLALTKAFILEVKYLSRADISTPLLQEFMIAVMMLARMTKTTSQATLIAYLNAANSVIHSMMRTSRPNLTPLDFSLPAGHAALLPMAIEFDLDNYVEHLLSRGHPATSRKHFDPYISFAIEKRFPKTLKKATWYPGNVRCLKDLKSSSNGGFNEGLETQEPVSEKSLLLLVRNGASIHEKRGDEPYVKHLRFAFHDAFWQVMSVTKLNKPLLTFWLDVVELLVGLGAEPSFFWRVLPERKVEELKTKAPDFHARLCEVLAVRKNRDAKEDESRPSPRLRALDKLKRRRSSATTLATKRTKAQ
ncbi:P-loop containing nucleoside triphosphate hydrolase [Ilyonectria robusta]